MEPRCTVCNGPTRPSTINPQVRVCDGCATVAYQTVKDYYDAATKDLIASQEENRRLSERLSLALDAVQVTGKLMIFAGEIIGTHRAGPEAVAELNGYMAEMEVIAEKSKALGMPIN